LQLLIKKKVIITSTLQWLQGLTIKQPSPESVVLDALAPQFREDYLKRFITITSSNNPTSIDTAFPIFAKMEKLFYDAGGLLTVGTDPASLSGVLAGYGNWRNIELLVEAAGFTPLEAIKIATLNGALAMGIEKQTGTIEPGKEADLIVIDGDPSQNISDIRKVIWVFKDGVGFNSKRMIESVKGKVGDY
jgi:hypothetical protein